MVDRGQVRGGVPRIRGRASHHQGAEWREGRVIPMTATHKHSWVDLGEGTAVCSHDGCRAVWHEHRYTQDPTGLWRCPCGAWTPKPPPAPDQVADLSAYNVRQLNPRRPRTTRKPSGERR